MAHDQPQGGTAASSIHERRIDAICDRFEASWKARRRPSIQDHIHECSDALLPSLLHELVVIDLAYRIKDGEAPSRAEYEALFPQHNQVIAFAFSELETSPGQQDCSIDRQESPRDMSRGYSSKTRSTSLSDEEEQPTQIDRYRILELLGVGGFGKVYLGYDDQLRRKVAVKVPRMDRVAEPESFLTEARTLASLDHPNIVNVYDTGQTSDGNCYIVSKWIEGTDLSQVAAAEQLSYRCCAELIAKIADALQYAHGRKLVHRDIKPANILIDSNREPYLTDFGLALREDAFGRAGTAGGTAAYMSPEQARGEGHLVDGRSDIFSLGAVFYYLLTGELPFKGSSRDELLRRIRTQEARPPRQLVADLPKELERICLKALSRQAKDRYTTAYDMADDLRHFMRSETSPAKSAAAKAAPTEQTFEVVPKGLRSFDWDDADFFLRLLPGPFDRDGLPEAIRFWKTRIEEQDPEFTFRVGLIYGPSGCGKSSLVKAGLLPRLADRVEQIYLECNGSDDEQRLLRGLRKRFSGLELGLSKTLAAMRRGQAMPAGHKILIVLDQFEQWLHANRDKEDTRLIDALRQCDGERVQCLLLIRDDFWMATTRFMRKLDEPIAEGFNSGAVHLFDPLHARKVLAEFGRSFGRLPKELNEFASDQAKFLDRAISDLKRDGEIIPVRLTLFADMVKGKPWTPATLKQYGGTGGVTITFLEESFSTTTAPPGHRLHEKAARAVLRALLPETGKNMKGHKRSHTQLLEASGYRERPQQFDDLMRILDTETRLLTPIEPASASERVQQPLQADTSERYYHLTHDYLVQPLREWLTRKEKETRRGRAALALVEQAELWNAKPEARHLPSLWEYLSFRLFTHKANWQEPVRKMMRSARNRLIQSATAAMLLGLIAVWIAYEWNCTNKARALIDALDTAATVEVPEMATEIAGYRRWARSKLIEISKDAAADEKYRLHASLVLINLKETTDDGSEFDQVFQHMLRAGPTELMLLRNALADHRSQLASQTWNMLQSEDVAPAQRFRAACALAAFDTDSPQWPPYTQFVAERLIAEIIQDPRNYNSWLQALSPLNETLLPPLEKIVLAGHDMAQSFATQIFARYAADNPAHLGRLLPDVDEEQFLVLFSRLQSHENPQDAIDALYSVLAESVPFGTPAGSSESALETLAKRQANAAVALLRLGHNERIWPLLRHQSDPSRRSYLVHRLGSLGADPGAIIGQLDQENETSIRRALILSLGEFPVTELTREKRKPLTSKLLDGYRHDPDPGIHAAAEWVLRQWKQDETLRQIDQELSAHGFDESRSWFVNCQNQTMVVFRDPPEFLMGSPTSEDDIEVHHTVRIGHSFAMSAKQVTVEQFAAFAAENMPDHKPKFSDGSVHCPVNMVSWYDAARYCNWLSEQHNLPPDQWCYQPNESNVFADGMRLTPGYLELQGYRLPTEAEWEYACRALAATKRYYGDSEELLGNYAWYLMNSHAESLLPVASLKPNDFGLFDMHGNLADWCQERLQQFFPDENGEPRLDVEDTEPVHDHVDRIIRGGKFSDVPNALRSGHRTWYNPYQAFESVGIRPTQSIVSKAE